MTLEKTNMRAAVYHEIGCDADDVLESSRRQQHEHAGGKSALRRLAKSLEGIAKVVDDDLDKGELADIGEPLKVAEYAKRQIGRCVQSALNAARHEESCELAAGGAASTAEQFVKRLKTKHDMAEAKAKAIEQGLADDELQTVSGEIEVKPETPKRKRPAGVRPAQSVAARRKAEAKKKPPAKKKASGTNARQNARSKR